MAVGRSYDYLILRTAEMELPPFPDIHDRAITKRTWEATIKALRDELKGMVDGLSPAQRIVSDVLNNIICQVDLFPARQVGVYRMLRSGLLDRPPTLHTYRGRQIPGGPTRHR